MEMGKINLFACLCVQRRITEPFPVCYLKPNRIINTCSRKKYSGKIERFLSPILNLEKTRRAFYLKLDVFKMRKIFDPYFISITTLFSIRILNLIWFSSEIVTNWSFPHLHSAWLATLVAKRWLRKMPAHWYSKHQNQESKYWQI